MMSGNVGLGPAPGGRASIRAMFPSEPEEPTGSDATEDASRLGEFKNATRGYAQIEADRESACTGQNGSRERQADANGKPMRTASRCERQADANGKPMRTASRSGTSALPCGSDTA